MRNGTPPIVALTRSLAMLEAIVDQGERESVAAIARRIGMPVATAHRQVTTLLAAGYLARLPGGALAPGHRLVRLLDRVDDKQVIVSAAAPVLNRLATTTGLIAQLGTLENDMVTYRIKAGEGAGGFFTKVGMQLEAYCSGIGKILLASLPDRDREAYLASGPFPALTKATITDPARLRGELEQVARLGYAVDAGEIAENIACIAVPVRKPDGSVPAAISISRDRTAHGPWDEATLLDLLMPAAAAIGRQAFGP